MKTESPWYVPSKKKRDRIYKAPLYWDASLIQAAQEIGREEGQKAGHQLSGPALLSNLALRRGPYYTQVQRRLKKRYQQLNKEYKNAHPRQNEVREDLVAKAVEVEPSAPRRASTRL